MQYKLMYLSFWSQLLMVCPVKQVEIDLWDENDIFVCLSEFIEVHNNKFNLIPPWGWGAPTYGLYRHVT